MPNYNYGHYLELAIVSVLDQQYPNLEFIIIDGGSTDNSKEIIKKYEKHLSYWVSEPDKGMYDAIDKGFQRSTGDIMSWLNSDDIYFPWALSTVAEVFSAFKEINWITTLQPGLMDYYGRILNFEHFKGFSRDAFQEKMYGLNKYFYGAIQQESTFWTRKLWVKAGAQMSKNYGLAGDFELWSRFFQHEQLYGVVSPLGCYRTQMLQKTNSGNNYSNQCREVLSESKLNGGRLAFLRRFLLYTRLTSLPKVGPYLTRTFGYEGMVVNRQNANTPESKWAISRSYFL
jgi:glycosyltransferase involved in cell wall biosynthesis